MTVRSVFVIGPDTRIKLTLTYPASAGRNFDELLRVVDSLQLTARHQVATPVNWRPGEDVIIVPALSDEQARERFPDGWKTLKPYLRVVPAPGRATVWPLNETRSEGRGFPTPPRMRRFAAASREGDSPASRS